MACEVMYTWSLSGLVGVFLDLVIAYFLLCISAMAFVASKFLGFFGLSLPCPCNGLFGLTNPNNNLCLQRVLLDSPTHKVSSVQVSLKKKFPFNGLSCEKDKTFDFDVDKLVEGRKKKSDCVNGFAEMEDGEASCSSVADGRNFRNFVGWREELSGRERRFDVKGKGVAGHRPRGWLRRRRKKGVDCGKGSSVSSCDPCASINNGDGRASRLSRSGQRDSIVVEEFDEEDENERNVSSPEVVLRKTPEETAFGVGEKHTIELLEHALKEERAARSALYLELEKERNAAATAADEAMAMILRLQEEKALLEMEARQVQRIVEEKSAYDEEEMNILQEILIRREREKLFLEKEVEVYRQMMNLANEQLSDDNGELMAADKQPPLASLLDPNEDPVSMLHQLSEAIDKKALIKHKSDLLRDNDEDQKVQEKEVISTVDTLYVPPQDGRRLETLFQACESGGSSDEHDLPDKTILISEDHDRDIGIMDDRMMRNDSEVYSHVLNNDDVHVTVDGTHSGNEDKRSQIEQSYTNVTSEGTSRTSRMRSPYANGDRPCAERDIQKSASDVVGRLPPIDPRTRSLLSDLRRNSTSPIEYERTKIENEVEWLRERLMVVQDGREKLNVSVESQEKEKLQLKLLEDISRELQQIRQLTQPGKATRQRSLPLPSSEVMTRRRRSQSASSGNYHDSS